MLDAVAGSVEAVVGRFDPLLYGRELARFQVRELLLRSRAGGRLRAGSLRGAGAVGLAQALLVSRLIQLNLILFCNPVFPL